MWQTVSQGSNSFCVGSDLFALLLAETLCSTNINANSSFIEYVIEEPVIFIVPELKIQVAVVKLTILGAIQSGIMWRHLMVTKDGEFS